MADQPELPLDANSLALQAEVTRSIRSVATEIAVLERNTRRILCDLVVALNAIAEGMKDAKLRDNPPA